MSHFSITATLFALLLWPLSLPAAAETLDASTITCADLVSASNSKADSDHMGAAAMLSWMAGYHATEDQGTVVDFDALKGEVQKTVEYCQDNSMIGVLTASAKFMGENAEEQSSGAIDLATIKCDRVIKSSKDDEDGLTIILMWLAGYYASDDEDKVIDWTKLEKESEQIGRECAESSNTGLVTVAEKYYKHSDE